MNRLILLYSICISLNMFYSNQAEMKNFITPEHGHLYRLESSYLQWKAAAPKLTYLNVDDDPNKANSTTPQIIIDNDQSSTFKFVSLYENDFVLKFYKPGHPMHDRYLQYLPDSKQFVLKSSPTLLNLVRNKLGHFSIRIKTRGSSSGEHYMSINTLNVNGKEITSLTISPLPNLSNWNFESIKYSLLNGFDEIRNIILNQLPEPKRVEFTPTEEIKNNHYQFGDQTFYEVNTPSGKYTVETGPNDVTDQLLDVENINYARIFSLPKQTPSNVWQLGLNERGSRPMYSSVIKPKHPVITRQYGPVTMKMGPSMRHAPVLNNMIP